MNELANADLIGFYPNVIGDSIFFLYIVRCFQYNNNCMKRRRTGKRKEERKDDCRLKGGLRKRRIKELRVRYLQERALRRL